MKHQWHGAVDFSSRGNLEHCVRNISWRVGIGSQRLKRKWVTNHTTSTGSSLKPTTKSPTAPLNKNPCSTLQTSRGWGWTSSANGRRSRTNSGCSGCHVNSQGTVSTCWTSRTRMRCTSTAPLHRSCLAKYCSTLRDPASLESNRRCTLIKAKPSSTNCRLCSTAGIFSWLMTRNYPMMSHFISHPRGLVLPMSLCLTRRECV